MEFLQVTKRDCLRSCCLSMALICTLLFALSAVAAPGRSGAPDTRQPPLSLTQGEQAWLAQHRSINIAFDGYFPPYSFLNEDREIQGMAVDILRLTAQRAGITLAISPKTVWKDIYLAAQKREVDLVATMGNRPERAEWFIFSHPFVFKSLVIMTMNKSTIAGPEDLDGRRVALVNSYQYVKPLLEKHPTIKPYYVDTMLDGLNAVATGKADAAITFVAAGDYLKSRYQLTNLKFAAIFDRDQYTESIAVRKDWPELASIMEKALDSISPQELQTIQKRWLSAEAMPKRVKLTDEEQDWLNDHSIIRVGYDPDFAPFELRDKGGRYVGISADYLKLLERRIGIRFQMAEGLSWAQIMDKTRIKEIDLLPCVGRTRDREEYLAYSESYTNSRRVIVTRNDAPFIDGLAAISNWKVAVQADTSNEGYLKENTAIKPLRYATVQEALVALSGGSVDAFVNNIGSTAHWNRELNITNLKIAAPVSEGLLYMAVRKDWPLLVSIINKGLASVSEEEKNQISQRWIAVDYKPGIAVGTVWKYALGGTVAALLIVAGFLAWNRMLKNKVQTRTLELELAKKYAENLIQTANVIFLQLDTMGCVVKLNKKAEEITGYRLAEIAGENWFELLVPKKCYPLAWHEFESVVIVGKASEVFENPIITKSGTERYILWKNKQLHDGDTATGMISFGVDVTERLDAEKEIRKLNVELEQRVADRTSELEKAKLALMNIVDDLNNKSDELQAANEKLKEVDRLKSMFIASMSHELRTPLNSVIGFSSILLNEWIGKLNDEQKKSLTSVLNSGKHLLSLINDVIDVSKIEAGIVEVVSEEFDLADLLAEVSQAMAKEALDRKLILTVPEVHLTLLMDRRRLLQCVLNLVSNGLKYTEQGTVTLAVRQGGERLEISVADSGIGISAEDQGRLFLPFSRIQSHLTAKVLGTGLGLYLTRKIVTEMLGGEIGVVSEPGKGSVFTITLPCRIEQSPLPDPLQ